MIEDGDTDVLFGEDHKLPEIVDDSKKKAGAASGNTSVQPASDDAVYNWLDVIPKKRLDASGDKHLLFNQLVGQAKEWDIEQQLGDSLSKINTYETDSPRFREAIFLFKRLQRSQEIHLGKDHTALAVTEMLIGMCQQEVRDFQTSAKTLRNAIVRFQQSEEADVNTFIECLCALSDSYNELDNFDASRTCIKQAYRLLTDDAQQRLQVRVLEALANVLMDEAAVFPCATWTKRKDT
jgi:tetratricopeptide (TPR) repeat protein